MSSPWRTGGHVIRNAAGALIICPDCPCGGDCPDCTDVEAAFDACPEYIDVTIAGMVGPCAFLNATWRLSKGILHNWILVNIPGQPDNTHQLTFDVRCGRFLDCIPTCAAGQHAWVFSVTWGSASYTGVLYAGLCNTACCPQGTYDVTLCTSVAYDPACNPYTATVVVS